MQALLEHQEAAAAAAAAVAAKNPSPPPVIVRYTTKDDDVTSSSEKSSLEGDPLDFYFDEKKSRQSSNCDLQHEHCRRGSHPQLEPSDSPSGHVLGRYDDEYKSGLLREHEGGSAGQKDPGQGDAGQNQRTNRAPIRKPEPVLLFPSPHVFAQTSE